ncbi:MAG: hypothetical protein US42_C0007G0035 [Candidatus Magasanikbacteria bacterium GW2011_GWC2_37_14]|uniref:Uncharacterized protein n=1 Tax=Candidatus Magasanikbacteria bacterium GW2011_GWC2_37_14 TaxID=1619046 RepID=A0A0G0IU33_9BACT|nr:MAG: hypothetical protein US42_C0007G0035 [Candidatus Magasanikbacteria bacterium GW2011_GWC2_37_14]
MGRFKEVAAGVGEQRGFKRAAEEKKGQGATVAGQIDDLERMGEFFASTSPEHELDVNYLTLMATELNGFVGDESFKTEVGREMSALYNISSEDEEDLKEGVQILQENASAENMSVEDLIAEYEAGDTAEKEKGRVLREMLEIHQRVQEARPKIREYCAKLVTKLLEQKRAENALTTEEQAQLQEAYNNFDLVPETYEGYCDYAGAKLVEANTTRERQTVKNLEHAVATTEKNRANKGQYGFYPETVYQVQTLGADGKRIFHQGLSSENAELTIKSPAFEREVLYDERRLRMEEMLWQDFFEQTKEIVEEELPGAENEAEKRKILEYCQRNFRLGANKSAETGYSQYTFVNAVGDMSQFSQLKPEAVKNIVLNFLQTKFLSDISLTNLQDSTDEHTHAPKPTTNMEGLARYLTFRDALEKFPPTENQIETGGVYAVNTRKAYELFLDEKFPQERGNEIRLGEYLQELFKNAVERDAVFLNKIQAIVEAEVSVLDQNTQQYILTTNRNLIKDVRGNRTMTGTLYETPDLAQTREEELREFKQRLSERINKGKTPDQQVALTVSDAERIGKEALERGKGVAAKEVLKKAELQALLVSLETVIKPEPGETLPKAVERMKKELGEVKFHGENLEGINKDLEDRLKRSESDRKYLLDRLLEAQKILGGDDGRGKHGLLKREAVIEQALSAINKPAGS